MKKTYVANVVVTAAVVLLLGGCEQYSARHLGGTLLIKVASDQQVVNVTWKEDNLWVLTKLREADHKPTVYTFKEDAQLGILEGTVVITEE